MPSRNTIYAGIAMSVFVAVICFPIVFVGIVIPFYRPYTILMVLCLVGIAIWIMCSQVEFDRWHERLKAGCCTDFGCDLRASKGVCPECGAGRRQDRIQP